jgi:hypothetical protein
MSLFKKKKHLIYVVSNRKTNAVYGLFSNFEAAQMYMTDYPDFNRSKDDTNDKYSLKLYEVMSE